MALFWTAASALSTVLCQRSLKIGTLDISLAGNDLGKSRLLAESPQMIHVQKKIRPCQNGTAAAHGLEHDAAHYQVVTRSLNEGMGITCGKKRHFGYGISLWPPPDVCVMLASPFPALQEGVCRVVFRFFCC